MIRQRNPTNTRDWQTVKIMMSGDVEREVVRIRRRGADGIDRVMWAKAAALSVSLNTDLVVGATASAIPANVQTSAVTASPIGGTAPFTYAWSQTAGDPAEILSPTNAVTAFRLISVALYDTLLATFKVTVTDAYGNPADSGEVTAQGSNLGPPGGGPIP